ncbi:MAG TPA: ParM/StbA family protein [Bacillota bacterium]
MKRVGVDLGYGYVKLSSGETELSFPSVVGVGQHLHYQSELRIHQDPLANMTVEVGGNRYFVGDLAIRQSGIAARSLDADRVGDRNAQVLLLAGLGMLTTWDKEAYAVVTGLPTSAFAADAERWQEALKGIHQVQFGTNGVVKPREIEIAKVRVIPQPFGSLYDQVLDAQGNVVDQDLAAMRIGIVDIGFKTSDLVVADGLEYIDHLSRSTTTAMSTAYDLIAEELRRTLHVHRENYELDRVIREGKIRLAGKVHDLADARVHAFRSVAAKILTEIESLWDFQSLDMIMITGGGGAALAQYLTGEFPHAHVVKDPQMANARGYRKFAQHLFRNGERATDAAAN